MFWVNTDSNPHMNWMDQWNWLFFLFYLLNKLSAKLNKNSFLKNKLPWPVKTNQDMTVKSKGLTAHNLHHKVNSSPNKDVQTNTHAMPQLGKYTNASLCKVPTYIHKLYVYPKPTHRHYSTNPMTDTHTHRHTLLLCDLTCAFLDWNK